MEPTEDEKQYYKNLASNPCLPYGVLLIGEGKNKYNPRTQIPGEQYEPDPSIEGVATRSEK